MNYIVCPKCSFENKGSRSICFNCGENLAGGRIVVKDQAPTSSSFGGPTPQSQAPARESATQSGVSAPSQKMRFTNKYSALKGIADLCNTIASIMAVLAGIVGFVGLISLFSEFLLGLAIILFAAAFGVSGYVIYKILAESIHVILDIEMNTRQTAAYTKFLIDRE